MSSLTTDGDQDGQPGDEKSDGAQTTPGASTRHTQAHMTENGVTRGRNSRWQPRTFSETVCGGRAGSLPRGLRRRILARIRSPAGDPRPPGRQKLSGADKYSIRHGRYRTLYSTRGNVMSITVVKVSDRKNVYRRARLDVYLPSVETTDRHIRQFVYNYSREAGS